MIKAIAIDDERPALEVLQAFCEETDLIDLRKTFTKTGEARQYLLEQPVDLLFLDINMPAQNGIDFARELATPAVGSEPMVIFTTAYSDYAVESYTLNAVDYLLKPFTVERFLVAAYKAADQVTRQQAATNEEYLLLRVDYGLVKVYWTQILFIKGLDNYLSIYLTDQKPIIVRLTFKAMLDSLPAKKFIRVHRSYIVALAKIQSVRNKHILMESQEIPLGSAYEAEFMTAFRG